MRLPRILYAVVFSTACFSASQGRDLQQQVESLQQQMSSLEKSSSKQQERLTAAISTAEQKMIDLEDLLKQVDKLSKGDFAKLGSDVDVLKRDTASIKINFDEIQQKFEEFVDVQKKLNDEIKRVAGIVDKPAPVSTLPTDSKELFAYAQNKLKEGVYVEARKAFREYLKSFAKGEFAQESQYLLGDAYQKEGKLEEAKREFSKVIESFADGERADDALYQLGVVSAALGQCSEAEVYFGEVAKNKKSSLQADANKQIKEIAKLKKDKKCKV